MTLLLIALILSLLGIFVLRLVEWRSLPARGEIAQVPEDFDEDLAVEQDDLAMWELECRSLHRLADRLGGGR